MASLGLICPIKKFGSSPNQLEKNQDPRGQGFKGSSEKDFKF